MNWDHILGAIISAILTVILHQTPWGQKFFSFLQGLPVVIFSTMMFYWGKLYGANVAVKQQNEDLLRTIEKCEKFKKEKEEQ